MNETIIESGMRFDTKDAWRIEKSVLYNSLNKGDNGFKVVEFIRAKCGNYVFVEAKSSFPNLNNPDNKDNVDKNITSILNKFIHSLSLLSSTSLHVNNVPETEMPDIFQQINHPAIQFVLVINFAEKIEATHDTRAICEEIRTAFEAKLSKELMRIWRARIWVMNKRQAMKQGLVLDDTEGACERI